MEKYRENGDWIVFACMERSGAMWRKTPIFIGQNSRFYFSALEFYAIFCYYVYVNWRKP
jgi:hypothetical protein